MERTGEGKWPNSGRRASEIGGRVILRRNGPKRAVFEAGKAGS